MDKNRKASAAAAVATHMQKQVSRQQQILQYYDGDADGELLPSGDPSSIKESTLNGKTITFRFSKVFRNTIAERWNRTYLRCVSIATLCYAVVSCARVRAFAPSPRLPSRPSRVTNRYAATNRPVARIFSPFQRQPLLIELVHGHKTISFRSTAATQSTGCLAILVYGHPDARLQPLP